MSKNPKSLDHWTSHDKLPNRLLLIELAPGDGIRGQMHVLHVTPWGARRTMLKREAPRKKNSVGCLAPYQILPVIDLKVPHINGKPPGMIKNDQTLLHNEYNDILSDMDDDL